MPSTMMTSHPRPAQRRTHGSPAPKAKFAFLNSAPTAFRRRTHTRRRAEPASVPTPRFTPVMSTHWHEFKLLPLAEAQKREEIVHRMFLADS
ncbi:hypothetical protein ACG7TL_009276 [Trametes sanguinea]